MDWEIERILNHIKQKWNKEKIYVEPNSYSVPLPENLSVLEGEENIKQSDDFEGLPTIKVIRP